MASVKRCNSIEDLASRLSRDAGRVPARFLYDMLRGIYESRSLNLTDIARVLGENIGLHGTHKRLSRNLARGELSATVSDQLLKIGARSVGQDTPLIVLMHKINKKYARRMEYLATDDGYRVCDILAHAPGSDTWVPLLTTLWSRRAPGYVSDTHEVRQATDRVLAATQGKGLFYLSPYVLPQKVLRGLTHDRDLRFFSAIAAADDTLIYRHRAQPVAELTHLCKTPFGKMMYKVVPETTRGFFQEWRLSTTELSIFTEVGTMPVRFPDAARPLSLVVQRAKGQLRNDTLAMLSSEPQLRSRKPIMDLVTSYMAISDVVAAHIRGKEKYRPADFRVFTYERLQLLMTLLNAVLFYELAIARSIVLSERMISFSPHEGELERDYLLPPAIALARC